MSGRLLSRGPGFHVIRHDSPDKAGKFPRYRCHGNILFLAITQHPVILAAHSGITSISVGYHLCAVAGLPGPQFLRFMTDLPFADSLRTFNLQTPQMPVPQSAGQTVRSLLSAHHRKQGIHPTSLEGAL